MIYDKSASVVRKPGFLVGLALILVSVVVIIGSSLTYVQRHDNFVTHFDEHVAELCAPGETFRREVTRDYGSGRNFIDYYCIDGEGNKRNLLPELPDSTSILLEYLAMVVVGAAFLINGALLIVSAVRRPVVRAS